jgi:hypothetical protein
VATLDLGDSKLKGETRCHRLQSVATTCQTSEVADSKALVGGGDGVDWSQVVGSEPGAGCVGRLQSRVGSDLEVGRHEVKSTQDNGLGAASTQNTLRCRICYSSPRVINPLVHHLNPSLAHTLSQPNSALI